MLRPLLLSLFLLSLSLSAQRERRFTVLSYNVENLYDTLHDTGKDDGEFLPQGAKRWTAARYWAKQGRMARVVIAASPVTPPELVALCEVENDSVIHDLCHRTSLRRLGYDYIVTRSNDLRGIDVALLYQPLRFRLLSHESLHIPYTPAQERSTRDILHATGIVPTGDTLHVFVCHFPSRSGGKRETEPYRTRANLRLKAACDSLFRLSPAANILIVGDFNDEATDAPIRRTLGAVPPPDSDKRLSSDALYILSHGLRGKYDIRGTYKYRNAWNHLDQVIVSGSLLLHDGRFRTTAKDCEIFCPDFLCDIDRLRHTAKPRRTYLGNFYQGGFSDHFPMKISFTYD